MEQRNLGDRFKWIGDDHHANVTMLEFTENGYIVVGRNRACGYSIGEYWGKSIEYTNGWKFIGNFAKSNNFKTIYDILNG